MAHDLQLQIEPLEFDYAMDQEWETGSPNRSSRDYIKWVQQSLNQIMGLHLAVDGISGTQTRSAVRSFQQKHGLAIDGIVDHRQSKR
jgi:peptidoglycan hydrolase-like protein with peptidoglycan-binding domain